jgi:arylsulfatase A-like enzyme
MARCLLVLWRQLICFGCLIALLTGSLTILAEVDGWVMFETSSEITVEIGARISIALALGLLAGTLAFLLTLPYVLRRPALMHERCASGARLGGTIALILGESVIAGVLVRWTMDVGLLNLTNQAYIVIWCGLSLALALLTVTWRIAAPRRLESKNKVADKFSGRSTRRLLLVAGFAAVFTTFSNRLVSRPGKVSPVAAGSMPPKPNILLVTFDALTAEDMSLYGYRLPTTPNIDALARSSTTFSNHYGTSTFTTSSIASMMTGRYPSSTQIYHYGGRLRGTAAIQTLPHVLRAAGYTTAASVANPGADPDCMGFGNDFDILPPPPIEDVAARETVAYFHSATLAAEAGFASRIAPYLLEELSPKLFGQTHSTFPPALSFQQAEAILDKLPSPFFLWIHVFAPHFPYLPDPPFVKEFLKSDELRTHSDFAKLFDLKGFNYSPAKQALVDKARLRYDEWILEADDAFGKFMEKLRASGQSDNTAMVVSADHGESFQGGYVGHGGPRQLRPILHVPLVVHLPGQTVEQRITMVSDHTALPPTILEIAGVARPHWMDGGPSLCASMRGETEAGKPLAFTEYFEANNAFKPITHGTVGVIDGVHQYVLDIDTNTGALYALDDAQDQATDLSALQPALAADMRAAIARQFPYARGA